MVIHYIAISETFTGMLLRNCFSANGNQEHLSRLIMQPQTMTPFHSSTPCSTSVCQRSCSSASSMALEAQLTNCMLAIRGDVGRMLFWSEACKRGGGSEERKQMQRKRRQTQTQAHGAGNAGKSKQNPIHSYTSEFSWPRQPTCNPILSTCLSSCPSYCF